MKFKCNVLFIIICLQTSISFAQTTTHTTEHLYDPAAKFILDKVSRTMKKDTTKTSTFTLVVKKASGKTDTVHGEIILKRLKYKIVFDKPGNRQEFYNDGKITAAYSQRDDEVAYDTAPDLSVQKNRNRISAIDIFTIHEKGFYYHFIKEDTLNGRAVEYIDLHPEKPEKTIYHTIHLVIDKQKKRIISIHFLNKDGSEVVYTIDSYTPNLPIPDNTFRFKPR